MPNKVVFHREKFNRLFRREMHRSMTLATEFLWRRARQQLSTRQITATIPINPPRKVGIRPSRPNESPRKVTGRLANSVTRHVIFRGSGSSPVIVGRVGTRLPLGRTMEFGSPGGQTIVPRRAKVLAIPVGRLKFTPSKKTGKIRRSGSVQVIFRPRVTRGSIMPRPWLRPALKRSVPGLRKILARRWDMSAA